MGACRHGQEGALALIWKCCIMFLCISSYSKTLSRRIIYALLSQLVISFWELYPQTLTGAPSLDRAGDFCPHTPNLPTPRKKSCGAYDLNMS